MALYRTPWVNRPLDLPEGYWISGGWDFVYLMHSVEGEGGLQITVYSAAGMCPSEIEFDAWGHRLYDLLDEICFVREMNDMPTFKVDQR